MISTSDMKPTGTETVRLLRDTVLTGKGRVKAGTEHEVSAGTARLLIGQRQAEPVVGMTNRAAEEAPKPKRGRPRKNPDA